MFNVGVFAICRRDSDVDYDRQLVLAFFCEYKTQRGRHRCSYVGLVPVGRNVRMFLEYLNYVVHVLPIAQERKTHQIAQKDFLTQEGFLGRFYTPVAT